MVDPQIAAIDKKVDKIMELLAGNEQFHQEGLIKQQQRMMRMLSEVKKAIAAQDRRLASVEKFYKFVRSLTQLPRLRKWAMAAMAAAAGLLAHISGWLEKAWQALHP